MVAMSPVFCFGIFGLLCANYVSSSCITEDNENKGLKETSCVRLALTNIPKKEIPQDTGILIMSFNNLKAISTSTFKGMKRLVELDLSHNALTSFKVDLPIMLQELNLDNNSFKSIPDLSQLSSLTKLVLSNNHISTIPDSAFKGLNNLKVLKLQKNTINSLSEEVFHDLKSLDHLDLSHNQLWELPNHLILNLVHLTKFSLAENKLTNIPDEFFDGLNSLAYVYLDKNPWNCNCALRYFKEWVEDNGYNIYTILPDGFPINDEKSVLCSDKTPLIEHNMDACIGRDLGDADQHITEPWITTTKSTRVPLAKTTPVLTTEKHPTSDTTTTKSRRLTKPIMTSTKQPETTPTADFSPTKVATSSVFCFWIFGILYGNRVSSSCITEGNKSKGMKETSCVRLALTSIPIKKIPQDTGILTLSFNNLKAISTSTFKGMKRLVELDLSHNALTSFKVDLPIMLQELNLDNNSFKSIPDLSQLSSLTRLVLSNNHISTIPDSAFKGLNNLKVLELQKNTINSLSDKVFHDLKSLDLLDLSNNQLRELPNHLILNLVHLTNFYLAGNVLTNIPDDFFDGLNSLAYVYLDKNPWNCNCAVHYFKEWVEDNGYNIYTILPDGFPINDEKSVLCSDKTPLIEYNMDACNGEDLGDVVQRNDTRKKYASN
ncbi:SLIT and NTRK-like protein 1 isoform X2 [Rana temporaria]|uniref:SLIT and NTRK-like protein 1 isoform X2 n=1 Tax=Rana temporaria TaxID=8407 RepID=UPI001AADF568|nr:SLIT and NTRK-like protein 1 isoform X2 [Rana temporaria]